MWCDWKKYKSNQRNDHTAKGARIAKNKGRFQIILFQIEIE